MTTPTLDALRALVTKWREIAATQPPLVPRCPGTFRQCANDLEAVLSAALASASAPRKGPKCINCGVDDDGGYCTEDIGPFCSVCWGHVLEAAAPPRAPETPQTHSAARNSSFGTFGPPHDQHVTEPSLIAPIAHETARPIVVYGHRGDDIAGLLEVDEPETPQTCETCGHPAHIPGLCEFGLSDGECPCDAPRAPETPQKRTHLSHCPCHPDIATCICPHPSESRT